MKRLLVLLCALLTTAGAVAQNSGAEEMEIINLIREKEGLPARLFAPVRGVMMLYGDIDNGLPEHSQEWYWEQGGAIKSIPIGTVTNEVMNVRSYFLALGLMPMMQDYLVSEAEWTAPGAKMYGSFRKGTYGESWDEWTIKDVPEGAHNLPYHHGVADLGTVDFGHIVRVEHIDPFAEVPEEYLAEARKRFPDLEEFVVYWKGTFIKETPFSVSERRFMPDRTFKTTIRKMGGKVQKYSTISNEDK